MLALVGVLLAVARPAHAATTFTVNSTADRGDQDTTNGICDTGIVMFPTGEPECTLRAAIQQANASSGADTIGFGISGSGVKTIAPSSALPTITDPVTIDGYTQPGAAPNTKAIGNDAVLLIELNGTNAGLVDGLSFADTANGSVVRGLIVNRFQRAGINLGSADYNIVAGNFVGMDATGTVDRGNGDGSTGDPGVYAAGTNNDIGGSTPAARNLISGNYEGVSIGGSASLIAQNRIQGNYIGTDRSGTARLGNFFAGVAIRTSKYNKVVGNVISGNDMDGVWAVSTDTYNIGGAGIFDNYIGTDATGTSDLGNSGHGISITSKSNWIGDSGGVGNSGGGNLISGNGRDGVHIQGAGATDNRVRGNYIGTDVAGNAALGNSNDGVEINGPDDSVVGGTNAGEGNLTSANGNNGVALRFADRSMVQGNRIGTAADGSAALGNSGSGLLLDNAHYNMVGGKVSGAGNTIAHAKGGGFGDGVAVTSGIGNSILSNSIFSNGGLGIDLVSGGQPDGVTPNDPGDTDPGPNALMNFPVLGWASRAGSTTTITGDIDTEAAAAGSPVTIQFFSNPEFDPSGHGEGKTYLGGTDVTLDTGGDASFTFTTTKAQVGEVVTATATSEGGTSEFSKSLTVKAPPDTTITSGPSGFVKSTSGSFGFSASEPGSKFQCSLDGATFSSCTSPKSYSSLPQGKHTFRVRAIDIAGNTDPTPAGRSWTVDTVAPKGTVKINGGAAYTKSPSVKLSLAASDPSPGSGIASVRLKNDGGSWSGWTTYATKKSWTLKKANGLRTVYVEYRDKAGNVSTSAVDTIKLDMTKPTISGMLPKPRSTTTDTTPTIKATVRDNLTNLSKRHIKLYVDGKQVPKRKFSYNRSTDRLSYTSKKLPPGKHMVKIVVRDAAGNVAVKKWSFKVVR